MNHPRYTIKKIAIIATMSLAVITLSNCGESAEDKARKVEVLNEIHDLKMQVSETKQKIANIKAKTDSLKAIEKAYLDSIKASKEK